MTHPTDNQAEASLAAARMQKDAEVQLVKPPLTKDVDMNQILKAIIDVTSRTSNFAKIKEGDVEGNQAVAILTSLTGPDVKKAINQNVEEVITSVRPFDPATERITVKPPVQFGHEDFSEDDEDKLYQYVKKFRNSPEFPDVSMCLNWLNRHHEKNNCKFSEETFREQLLSMLPHKDQRTAMAAFIKKGVPAKVYYQHLQTSYKNADTKQDALLKLSMLLSDHTKPHLEVARGIEKLFLTIEDDPEKIVYSAVQEALRYYSSFAGPEVAEQINVSFNNRQVKNYNSLLDVIKLNENYIQAGRERVLAQQSKKIRQVQVDEDDRTIFINQTRSNDSTLSNHDDLERDYPDSSQYQDNDRRQQIQNLTEKVNKLLVQISNEMPICSQVTNHNDIEKDCPNSSQYLQEQDETQQILNLTTKVDKLLDQISNE